MLVGGGSADARDASYGPSGTYVVEPLLADTLLDDAAFRCPKPLTLPAPGSVAQARKRAQRL